jgi:hypothetical protein
MPRARSRRCAITVNPATDTSPMNTSPSTATTSTIVAGLMPALPDWLASETSASAGRFAKMGGGGPCVIWSWSWPGPGGALSRMVTWVGAVTCPGATSANSSLRSAGFSTMPVTSKARPSACQVPPVFRLYSDATWLVSATWPGPLG